MLCFVFLGALLCCGGRLVVVVVTFFYLSAAGLLIHWKRIEKLIEKEVLNELEQLWFLKSIPRYQSDACHCFAVKMKWG